eukprot:GCRY01005765.1.p1 GENE.GCRY01005765.1~~GCRY01005765.1.p1  ORF type:complete len:587 (-),score=143.00 GCRY01005765.1:58-1818(-)
MLLEKWQEIRAGFPNSARNLRSSSERATKRETTTSKSKGRAAHLSIQDAATFEKAVEAIQIQELRRSEHELVPLSFSRRISLSDIGPSDVVVGALLLLTLFSLRRGTTIKPNDSVITKARYGQGVQSPVAFSSIVGMGDVREEIEEFLSFLKHPERFSDMGAKIPRGALLVGPPGTGKTMLARALASECGVNFLHLSGAAFMELYVGVGPARVRDLFEQAAHQAPCIVYIDEVDAIGRQRSSGGVMRHDESEATLNELLVQMDGFDTHQGVIVLASTNRPDILDSALRRPGRFDRIINIDLPTKHARAQIFRSCLAGVTVAEDQDMDPICNHLASLTPGCSGADIATIVNESAIIAGREQATAVTEGHLQRGLERVLRGIRLKTHVFSPKEKHVLSVHEAGHILCSWLLPEAPSIVKASLVSYLASSPAGVASGGHSMWGEEQENLLYSDTALFSTMTSLLGGQVAEEEILGSSTTEAYVDYEHAAALAQQMVAVYGMSPRLGNMAFPDKSKDGQSIEALLSQKGYSDTVQAEIDDEVSLLLTRAYAAARKIVTNHRTALTTLAQQLADQETLGADAIEAVLGAKA